MKTTEVFIDAFFTEAEAVACAEDEDNSGFHVIEVASFAEDGEYITHWVRRNELRPL